jgi:hypothetical protein
VGCENGTPRPNVTLPETAAPSAFCPDQVPPDVLTQSSASNEAQSKNLAYETGTVIVIGISHQKIVIAADSRSVRGKLRPDGSFEVTKYDDSVCKVTQLTPTLLFAADGEVSSDSPISTEVLYDAHQLARLAAQNYHSHLNSPEEKLSDGIIGAIATRWAWDVDFRMRHGLTNGWRPTQTVEGIFVGLDESGETAMAVAKLEYTHPGTGVTVPPVTFSIGRPSPPPLDYTFLRAFGMKDWAETYYSVRPAGELPDPDNKNILGEIYKDPRLFSAIIPVRLVDLTIQHYANTTSDDSPLFVHGPIDEAAVERKKEIRWVHKKECSIAKEVPAKSDKPGKVK